jgi:hypothetical protein
MGTLTRNEILKANDLDRELVPVPEWGGDVYVRAMSGAERDKFESSLTINRGKNSTMNLANIRAKLAAMSICDESGKRLFDEADIQALGQKSAAALQRVFVVAQRLSGIGDDAVQELAEALEENPLEDSVSA